MKYISIDTGKFETKAAYIGERGEPNRLRFATKIEEADFEVNGKDSFAVSFEGKNYVVGKAAATNSIDTTKAQILHKICAYTAIHRLVKNNDDLIIAIGCPLSVFRDTKTKQDYISYLFPTKEVIIAINGETKTFKPVKVVAFPEGSGAIYRFNKIRANEMIGIIDIGGLNVNGCIYDKGTPLMKYAFTSNQGGQIFNMDLLNILEAKYHTDLKIDTIPKVLLENALKNHPESREDIKKAKKAHVEKIIKDCKQNGWDVNNIDLAFIGGASKLLASEIRELLPDAKTFENPTWINVDGWLKAINTAYEPIDKEENYD